MRTDRLPEVTRADAGTILIASRYVAQVAQQETVAEATISAWEKAPPPPGFLHLSCFVSTDGETVLAYSQWTSDEAHRTFTNTAPPSSDPAVIELAEPVRYRLYRSIGDDRDAGAPGLMITATFDVDGPERQRHITDRLIDTARGIGPLPGALSSHFHHSLDGTRVLNYALWTSIEDHDRAVANSDLDEIYRISTETPGVRPTRGRAYRLHSSLAP